MRTWQTFSQNHAPNVSCWNSTIHCLEYEVVWIMFLFIDHQNVWWVVLFTNSYTSSGGVDIYLFWCKPGLQCTIRLPFWFIYGTHNYVIHNLYLHNYLRKILYFYLASIFISFWIISSKGRSTPYSSTPYSAVVSYLKRQK